MVTEEKRRLHGCLACGRISVVPAFVVCEAGAGACSAVLSPVERAAPGWRRGERQQVYREAEQAQWRLSLRREASPHCVRRCLGRGAAHCPAAAASAVCWALGSSVEFVPSCLLFYFFTLCFVAWNVWLFVRCLFSVLLLPR